MHNIWFTSDTHAFQKNICRGLTPWDYPEQCRDFANEIEMTEKLIENINNNVKCNDVLYCLGDWSFGGRENIWNFRKRLNVKIIHLILGNHDELIAKNCIIDTGNGFINAHSLFTSVNQLLDKKINGQNMFLSHYSMRVWHKASKGSWNLYGHSHNNLSPYEKKDGSLYKSMDIGLETHSEFRPYHFDEINNIFKQEQYIDFKEDHHK